MGFRYEWKELTEDGLLKEPKDVGPYYSRETLNGYGGFETEDSAVEEYERFKKAHGWSCSSELILVKIYRPES